MNKVEALSEYKRSEEEEKQMGQKTAARFSTGKIRHDLIPPFVLDELAKVYTYGCQKYDPDNWRKGLKWREDVIGPLKRHLEKWIRGEQLDDESNCFHLSMVIWQCAALMIYEKYSVGVDDRHPFDLDLMGSEEQLRRIVMWKKHADVDTISEYNGLNE